MPSGLYLPVDHGTDCVKISLGLFQSLFDFLSHLTVVDIASPLRCYTTFTEAEIAKVNRDMDAIHEQAWNAGLRPRKVRAEYTKQAREAVGTRLITP